MKIQSKQEEVVVTQALIEETTSVKKIDEYMKQLHLHIQNGNSIAIAIITTIVSSIVLIAIICVLGIGYNLYVQVNANHIDHLNYGKIVVVLSIVSSCMIAGVHIAWIRNFLKFSLKDHRELVSNKELYTLCEKQKALLLEKFTQEISTLSVNTRQYLAENGL